MLTFALGFGDEFRDDLDDLASDMSWPAADGGSFAGCFAGSGFTGSFAGWAAAAGDGETPLDLLVLGLELPAM
jgi:hypothetical protein